MKRALIRVFGRSIQKGRLEIVDSSGERHTFGDGSGEPVRIRITTDSAERGILLYPQLRIGETYTDGELVVEEGSLYRFIEILLTNQVHPYWSAIAIEIWRRFTRRFRQINTRLRARRNVAHHYDLDGRIYALFLDGDMQYSCAYFEDDDWSLEEAQLAKKRHLAAKLRLEPGQRILDIGSGWGGLGLYLAEHFNADVTGLTLSKEQYSASNRRAEEAGLAGQVRFRLEDYRETQGPFDRIVSVGMFEHVGVGYYRTFFETCRDLLANDGVMLLHTIGRPGVPGQTGPWAEKYIFPGGYSPAMSEVIPAIERARLFLTDVEILRLHYAKTLRHWRQRFAANREQAAALTDERFCRMWEFFLTSAELSFSLGLAVNFQFQIARDYQAVPLTRGYINEIETALRGADQATDDVAN